MPVWINNYLMKSEAKVIVFLGTHGPVQAISQTGLGSDAGEGQEMQRKKSNP
jgi:hypothetical protein